MKINPGDLDYRDVYRLFMSAVVPRPIALISTIGENGVFNLAPFSGFSTMGLRPSLIHVNIGRNRNGQKKDTLVNIEFSKDLVTRLRSPTG